MMSLLFTQSVLASKINYADAKITYLDFWASWCIPCRASFPWMNDILKKYSKSGLQIIAVNLDGDTNLAKDFLKKVPADFKVIFDSQAELATEFKVSGMPNSFILNNKGELLYSHVGFNNKAKIELEKKIQGVLR